MSVTPLRDEDQPLPEPQGHAIGFVDTKPDCDAVTQALNAAGFPDSAITVFGGEDGLHLLKRMMSGSLWGETAEDVLKQGTIELSHGHFALIVEAEDRDQAVLAANVSAQHGGHGFNHFGVFADERLTK
jgi:hypothetical protein